MNRPCRSLTTCRTFGARRKPRNGSAGTFKNGDSTRVLTATVLERKAPTKLVSKYEGMQLPFYLTSSFRAVDDGSTEWAAEIEVKLNLMQKALGPLLKGTMSDMARNMGDDFKAYCESR